MRNNPQIQPSAPQNKIKAIVIGGGAAGFFGAITLAETNPLAKVILLEKGAHVLTKVRISGGGRCNVTHSCFDPKKLATHYPRGGKELLGPFHKFQPKNTIEWFERHGVPLKTEADGRMFPQTDASISIVNALRDAAQALGVEVRTNCAPTTIVATPEGFKISTSEGQLFIGDKILLACGSSPAGYEWAKQMGHSIVPPVPSLFTFAVPDERLKGLAGISLDNVEVGIAGTALAQKGAILVTHWGLSGPAILKLSAWGARILHEKGYAAELKINWVGIPEEMVFEHLQQFKSANLKKQISSHAPLGLPLRLWERLASNSLGPKDMRWADASNMQMRKLSKQLSNDSYIMRGKSTFKDEFVTCGGVKLDEVNFKTMESRIQPGLFFAGEILDIDGVTGGFNFQNAWTTSYLAGQAMGR